MFRDALDLAPFALPGTARSEVRFEETRDIAAVEIRLAGESESGLGLSYLRKTWPDWRVEEAGQGDPCALGWLPQDDWFNVNWTSAATVVETLSDGWIRISFQGLAQEFPQHEGYNVHFRRTLGIRLEGVEEHRIQEVRVYSVSESVQTDLSLHLDEASLGDALPFTIQAHNAKVEWTARDGDVFRMGVRHLMPAHPYGGDEGLLTFEGPRGVFTVSLNSLEEEGPIRSEEFGVLLTRQDDTTTPGDYDARRKDAATLSEMVRQRPEQSLAGALYGQPRPQPVSYSLGCPYARQRFWVEPNGDLLLHKRNTDWVSGRDTEHFACGGDARIYFGLERWLVTARFPDAEPMLGYTMQARRDGLLAEQRCFAVRLLDPDPGAAGEGDDPVAALVSLRFRNESGSARALRFPLGYSQDAGRSPGCRDAPRGEVGTLVPRYPLDTLTLNGNAVCSVFGEQPRVRFLVDTVMFVAAEGQELVLAADLPPGGACEAVLKIPYVEPGAEACSVLRAVSFDAAHEAQTAQWRAFSARGARVVTPEPRLNALHRMHPVHVAVTDFAMPGNRRLINTSVGTSTYGNFSNESTMIVHELDQRGFHEEARRRLEVWLKYQGTVPQPGNFTDHDGMFYGAGGFEQGAYNQHHGWVLWCLCEHFFLTQDEAWFRSVADAVVAGADWVFRQRRETMKPQVHSRGWEQGFLPAGSLEDVTDFYYWLSTNSLTWRGCEWAARALERIAHPEAARIRTEADGYRNDLRRGFDSNRDHAPLVRLRDGRWVPHYPSRLYRRGRDTGWIRETLEGAVYLLISGLYDVHGPEADWILDDYQDNRYPSPPYGYAIPDFEATWFNRAGISMQPNLLAGLLPHLERDEPELYIWMFCNAWASCYRDEINAMVEHPFPVLGYSNQAHFKTSDQANAIMWLRYMFVYRYEEELWLGRAVPRAWFAQGEAFGAWDVVTHFGKVSVSYMAKLLENRIEAEVLLDLTRAPSHILLRFRHPEGKVAANLELDGVVRKDLLNESGDVNLTGLTSSCRVAAIYE